MGFWKDFGSVMKNIGILALKTVSSIVSTAGAIASGGLTAPIAALSFASAASSWFDFIKSPTGNVNRSIINTADWVAKTIGFGGHGRTVLAGVNAITTLDPFTSAASSVGLPAFSSGGELKNLASAARNITVSFARSSGLTTATPDSIARLISPPIRDYGMATGNVFDRMRLRVAREMMNITAMAGMSDSMQTTSQQSRVESFSRGI